MSDAVLKRIEIAGGKPLTLCAAGEPFGASWQGNRIVFSIGSRILSVPDTAGAPETLVSSPEGRETFTRPQVVQDGKALVYTMRSSEPFPSFDDAQIVVQPLGGGPRRVLVDGGTDGRVLPTGHLTWIREGTLYAQALDLQTLQLTGGPVSILENVRESPTGAAQVAFAENGTMVFAGTEEPRSDSHLGRSKRPRGNQPAHRQAPTTIREYHPTARRSSSTRTRPTTCSTSTSGISRARG